MKSLLWTGFFLLLLNSSCQTYETDTLEMDRQQLEEQYNAIIALTSNVPCEDGADWAFTAIGTKACGGPTGYVAYPLSIDVTNFLHQVALYTEAAHQFNIKWGIMSDCSVPATPTAVICVDGQPQFEY